MDGRIIIVGAGECGARTATELRNAGFSGSISLVGAEAHAPYERPPLSKDALVEGGGPRHFAPAARYGELGIDLVLSCRAQAVRTDRREVVLDDGTILPFDRLLLATGARPRPWPGQASTGNRILTLRTHEDAGRLREVTGAGRSLAIIGGGFIGLEVAASARKLGANVVLIEAQPRLLARGVPEAIAAVLADRHRAEGVDLRTGCGIAALREAAGHVEITLADGGVLRADTVLVGIGAAPDTALAESAGLALDNGIAVDDRLETSVPGIFAAGDCCSFPLALYGGRRVRLESWRNAHDQAVVVAHTMLGHDRRIAAVPWFWSDQYDMTLQVAGLADGAALAVERRRPDGGLVLLHLDAGHRLLAASGIGPGNSIARDIRPAEMLIEKRRVLDPDLLRDPNVPLKSLLAS